MLFFIDIEANTRRKIGIQFSQTSGDIFIAQIKTNNCFIRDAHPTAENGYDWVEMVNSNDAKYQIKLNYTIQ